MIIPAISSNDRMTKNGLSELFAMIVLASKYLNGVRYLRLSRLALMLIKNDKINVDSKMDAAIDAERFAFL